MHFKSPAVFSRNHVYILLILAAHCAHYLHAAAEHTAKDLIIIPPYHGLTAYPCIERTTAQHKKTGEIVAFPPCKQAKFPPKNYHSFKKVFKLLDPQQLPSDHLIIPCLKVYPSSNATLLVYNSKSPYTYTYHADDPYIIASEPPLFMPIECINSLLIENRHKKIIETLKQKESVVPTAIPQEDDSYDEYVQRLPLATQLKLIEQQFMGVIKYAGKHGYTQNTTDIMAKLHKKAADISHKMQLCNGLPPHLK